MADESNTDKGNGPDGQFTQADLDRLVKKRLAEERGKLASKYGGNPDEVRTQLEEAAKMRQRLEDLERKAAGQPEPTELERKLRQLERERETLASERETFGAQFQRERELRVQAETRSALRTLARAAGAGTDEQADDAATLMAAAGLFEAIVDPDTGRISLESSDPKLSPEKAAKAFLERKSHLRASQPGGAGTRGAAPPPDPGPKDSLAGVLPGGPQFAVALREMNRG